MQKPSLLMFLTLCVFILLSACNANSDAEATSSTATPGAVADNTVVKPTLREALLNEGATSDGKPLQCQSNADCVVKDVGSCCGYNPQCVHKDQATDPAAVKEQCAKEGRSSICGFQEPAGCECVNQQCKNIIANMHQ